jgi:hypothetical protein
MNTALLPVFAAPAKAHGEANTTLIARLRQFHLQPVSRRESQTQWADTEISPLQPQ